MKKIILVFVLLTGIKTAHSQHFHNSSFSLNTAYNGFFAVRFDQAIYQSLNSKFNFENNRAGQYDAEVIKYRNKDSGPDWIPIFIAHRWITIQSNSDLMAFADENRQICVCKVILNYMANNTG